MNAGDLLLLIGLVVIGWFALGLMVALFIGAAANLTGGTQGRPGSGQ